MFRASATSFMLRPTSMYMAPVKKAAAVTATSDRFKSTPLQSTKNSDKGATPAAKIFAKSFFDGNGKGSKSADDWLNLDDDVALKAGSATTKAVGKRGTKESPQRRPKGVRRPFSLLDDAEKDAYRKTVRRNLLALQNTDAAAAAAKQALLNNGKKAPMSKGSSRVHSPFFTDSALRVRGSSVSVPLAPVRKVEKKKKPTKASTKGEVGFVDDHVHSTHKPLDGSDGMNPIAISQSFFTSYERKQFDRLKQATRSMRLRFNRHTGTLETVSQSAVRRRHQMYRLWDKLVLKVTTDLSAAPASKSKTAKK